MKKKKVQRYSVEGVDLTLKELGQKYELPQTTIRYRIQVMGMSAEAAILEGRHTRATHIDVDGKPLLVRDAAQALGVSEQTIYARLAKERKESHEPSSV